MSTSNEYFSSDDVTAGEPGNNRLAVLAAEIRTACEDAHRSAEYSAQRAYDAGERLMEARDSPDIPFGRYERWVKEVVGIPRETAKRYVQLFNAVSTGRVSIPDITEAGQVGVLRMLRTQEARERRERSRSAEPFPDGMDLRIVDCRVGFSDIPDNCIQLILTDPPYESAAAPLWLWLGDFAARALTPGGSLVCYFGNTQVDKLHRILGDVGLVHHFAAWMTHDPDHAQRLAGKFVIAQGKPILWYVKEYREGHTLVPNVVTDSIRDKSAHNWAQGDGGVRQWIHHLSEPGETIVDPFAGTATWGRIAVEMGRRWTGCDVVEGGSAMVVA